MDKLSGKNNMVPKLSRLSKAFFVAIGCGCGTSLVCIYLYNKMQGSDRLWCVGRGNIYRNSNLVISSRKTF